MSCRLVFQSVFPTTSGKLFELHSRTEALGRLSPSFPPVKSIDQDGEFKTGTSVRIRIGIGPLAASWVAVLEEVVPGRRFIDVQKEGPFRSWRHVHRFLPAPEGCVMQDEVTWASRGLLALFDRLIVRPMLRSYFRQRHAALMTWVNEENEKLVRAEAGPKTEQS